MGDPTPPPDAHQGHPYITWWPIPSPGAPGGKGSGNIRECRDAPGGHPGAARGGT
ncbi:MAG: hypothetical protein ACRDIV_02475 [Ktedonobacteraceae bacterium]